MFESPIRCVRILITLTAALTGVLAAAVAAPDPLLPVPNGPRRPDPSSIALVNATVVPEPGQKLEHATVVMRDGRIVQVLTPPTGEAGAKTPDVPGARTVDCTGLWIYAGFVETYAEVDVPRPDPDQKGTHWSEQVMPQRSALDGKGVDEQLAGSLRKLGFGAAAVVPKGGIFRGWSAVVSLAKPSDLPSIARPPVYARNTYQSIDFTTVRGDRSGEGRWPGYPDSHMGCIALIRQTLSDADWFAERRKTGEESGPPTALDAIAPGSTLVAFNADDELEVLRAIKIAREFKRPPMIVGSGTEFRRLDAIAGAAQAQYDLPALPLLVLPLRYPERPKAASVGEAEALELRELMTWEQAPTNVRRVMARVGDSRVAITSSKLRDRGKFLENLRAAIKAGLTEDRALAALTTTPAQFLNLSQDLGRVASGYRANLVVTDGPVFGKKTKILDVYVDGQRHEISEPPTRVVGTFVLSAENALPTGPAGLTITLDKDKGVTIKQDEPPAPPADAKKDEPATPKDPAAAPAAPEAKKEELKKEEPKKDKPKSARGKNVQILDQRFSFVIDAGDLGVDGQWAFSGVAETDASGKVTMLTGDALAPDGRAIRWSAARRDDDKPAAGAAESKPDADKPRGDKPKDDGVSGTWSLTAKGEQIPGGSVPMSLAIKRAGDGAVSGSVTAVFGTLDLTGSHDAATGKLTLTLKMPDGQSAAIDAVIKDDTLTGTASGGPVQATLTGNRTAKATAGAEDGDDDQELPIPEELPGYPFGPYAFKKVPEAQHVVITHATVWTSGPRGVIEDGEVEFQDGKLTYVGPSRGAPGAGVTVIDAKGKHVTPGLIDCHSHTGISGGVNESGMAVTTQVRIGDVTNPDAINWYRQLAGGLTCVNNLHGSANPMGGQNQVNKIRWGCIAPDDMHLAGAAPGVKFALGENVKQSNWGDRYTTRYPQTRMGVEAIMRDRFIAAREYARAMEEYKNKRFVKPEAPPRRDLQLEALAEILAGQRLVHCHSYRQDEILMLGRLAREMGFKIGTYQHILEGYKVAEVIREQAIGASCFSDWWAYKVEVQDAIPQAGPIMHEQGVVVSFNSDSDELARRMNVEAGKAVKYSRGADGSPSVTPEEALKFVTLNPAKQLKIDDKVGSLEVGKDADVVIWSGSPLSAMSRCESTWVDGRLQFSLEQDNALREQNQRERARLMQRLLGAKKKADDKPKADAPGEAKPGPKPTSHHHDAAERLELVRRGVNPEDARPGACGCED